MKRKDYPDAPAFDAAIDNLWEDVHSQLYDQMERLQNMYAPPAKMRQVWRHYANNLYQRLRDRLPLVGVRLILNDLQCVFLEAYQDQVEHFQDVARRRQCMANG